MTKQKLNHETKTRSNMLMIMMTKKKKAYASPFLTQWSQVRDIHLVLVKQQNVGL